MEVGSGRLLLDTSLTRFSSLLLLLQPVKGGTLHECVVFREVPDRKMVRGVDGGWALGRGSRLERGVTEEVSDC